MRNRMLSNAIYSLPFAQRGVVLIVGLIMVLLMTIVGLAAIRGTGLQENMAGNMRDRNIAFQAAESALREGEAIVSPGTLTKDLPTFNCAKGKGACLDLSAAPEKSVFYMTEAEWDEAAKVSVMDIKDLADKPSYLLEELEVDMGASAAVEGSAIDVAGMMTTGDATPYRITARGYGLSQDAEAIVQSAYKRRFK
jgi:type IV pilus assembly protein PilX